MSTSSPSPSRSTASRRGETRVYWNRGCWCAVCSVLRQAYDAPSVPQAYASAYDAMRCGMRLSWPFWRARCWMGGGGAHGAWGRKGACMGEKAHAWDQSPPLPAKTHRCLSCAVGFKCLRHSPPHTKAWACMDDLSIVWMTSALYGCCPMLMMYSVVADSMISSAHASVSQQIAASA